jgi:tetratricopeptide (TPR) repeat protein
MADRSILVNKEPEGYRIVAFYGAYRGAARLALSLAEQGKADQARVWLDRVRQEVPIGSGDDPISGALFSRLWQEGSSTADASAVRRAAAALLIAEDTAAVTLPILEDARAKADPSLQNVVSAALGEVYFGAKQYSKALAIAEELMKALPQSPTALRLALRSAYALGGREQAERVIKANLDRFAQNIPALRMMGAVALTFGDTERSSAMGREIIAAGRATASDYNQVAWGDLVGGKVTAESLDFGNKGLLESNNSPGIMHTLAAVEAEAGKLAEARAMILQRLKTQNSVEPDENDWYVFGRIAEQYGLTTEASVMYRRLSKPKNELAIPSSSYALAQRRLVLLEPGSAKVPAR